MRPERSRVIQVREHSTAVYARRIPVRADSACARGGPRAPRFEHGRRRARAGRCGFHRLFRERDPALDSAGGRQPHRARDEVRPSIQPRSHRKFELVEPHARHGPVRSRSAGAARGLDDLHSHCEHDLLLRPQAQDDAGNWSLLSNVVQKNTSSQVDVPDVPSAPGAPVTVLLQFSAPWPNPARNGTAFTLGLPEAADVQIVAFDVQGRQVRHCSAGPSRRARSASHGT